MEELPEAWTHYDLIVTLAMLEYLPPGELERTFAAFHGLLSDAGTLVVFISRRNAITIPLIRHWWKANLYHPSEIEQRLGNAGFRAIRVMAFPPPYRHLNLGAFIVEGTKSEAMKRD